jgi:hypothetical protein
MNSIYSDERSGRKRSRKILQFFGGMLWLLVLSLPVFSQGDFGRILGTVTDQSNGVVAGATVTVIDTERGVTRVLTTDESGEYNAPNLTPSVYTVRVEAPGFKKLEHQKIEIEVGKEVRVDLTVQPGEQEQTVTVNESLPLVETTNATLGGTLNNADISDMPLNAATIRTCCRCVPVLRFRLAAGRGPRAPMVSVPMNPHGWWTASSTPISMTLVPSPTCRVPSPTEPQSYPSTPSRNSTFKKIPRRSTVGNQAP